MKINDLQKAYPANQRVTNGTADRRQPTSTAGRDSPQGGPLIICSVSVEACTCDRLVGKHFFDRMNRISFAYQVPPNRLLILSILSSCLFRLFCFSLMFLYFIMETTLRQFAKTKKPTVGFLV